MPTKACIVKTTLFPIVIYKWESWTIRKSEHQRIVAFKLWCWRRLLRITWTARRSKQSILKDIKSTVNIHWKDWCWSWNSNTFTTYLEELTHSKRPRYWERLRVREDDDKGWDGLIDLMDMSLRKRWEIVKDREAWLVQFTGSQRVGHDLVTERQQPLKLIFYKNQHLTVLIFFIFLSALLSAYCLFCLFICVLQYTK